MSHRDIENSYPLSHMQKGMLFHALRAERSGVDIQQMVLVLHEELSVSAFRKAWEQTSQRHPILRTSFRWDGLDEPLQDVHHKIPFPWEECDLQEISKGEQAVQQDCYLRADRQRGFDLSNPPLWRLALSRVAVAEYQFIWSFHHALLDGRSFLILIEEVFAFYNAIRLGENLELAEPSPYRGYIDWLQKQQIGRGEAFWRKLLSGFSAPTPFTIGRTWIDPSESSEPEHAEQTAHLSARQTSRLQTFAAEEAVTLNTLVQGAWALLLSRYSGEDDVVFGATRACRRSVMGAETMVGLLINTLPIRLRVPPRQPLGNWLKELREQQIAIRDFEHTPLAQVQAWSEVPRGQPLFQSILVYEHRSFNSVLKEKGNGWQGREFRLYGRTNYPLSVAAWGDRELTLRLAYQKNRFDDGDVKRMLGHFVSLLEQMTRSSHAPLCELGLLTGPEAEQLLREWNRTAVAFVGQPKNSLLHELFEAQVNRTPERIAVELGDQAWTYQEIDDRANQLANYLRSLGIGPEMLVGICLERSVEMIVAMLGVLKSGAAYVPLDPGYPLERLSFMVEDARIPVLLTQEGIGLLRYSGKVIRLAADWGMIQQSATSNPHIEILPDQTAYVIYTSGSTGKPKGVMISHGAIWNHMLWMQQVFPLTGSDRVLQKTPFSFDASVWEFYLPLMTGACLVLARPGGHQESDYLVEVIIRRQVTILQLVPTLLRVLLDEPDFRRCISLRRVFCGGEALTTDLQDRFFTQLGTASLHNLYGPTEAAIDSTFWTCLPDVCIPTVPIGRPIHNAQTYILDANLQPVPVGVQGELLIGGRGLARGYLNRPELTAEKFIPNPFTETAGLRLYKTGDRCRYLSDGNIEYLGRIDHQVKVRGFRIELGEIESLLAEHPSVKEARVIDREDVPGERRLVSYVAAKTALAPTVTQLREFLGLKLPDYMIPTLFVFLDKLPLTPNGKVDRRALPAPQQHDLMEEKSFVAPRNAVEATLAKIWAEKLRVVRVGIHDNFFELGGDSIVSIQIISKANQAGVRLTPMQFFRHQTIAELAAVAGIPSRSLSQQDLITGDVPLTPVQHWFFELDLPARHHWNQSRLLEMRQQSDPATLERAFQLLVLHHDALRMRYTQQGSGWRQVIAGAELARILVQIDLSTVPSVSQKAALDQKSVELQASLDLSAGPLLRARLFNLGPERGECLLVAIHHLVVDAVSWRILLEDLQSLYEQVSSGQTVNLPGKTTSFKEWAERLLDYAQSPVLKSESAYWQALRSQPFPALRIDFPSDRHANTEGSTGIITTDLNDEETRVLLREVPAAYHTQINDVLLTALAQALRQWMGSRSVLIDQEGHGREELFEGIDLSRTVGWFTTIFPARLDLPQSCDPGEALKSIKEQLRRIPKRGIGYGLLLHLNKDPDLKELFKGVPRSELCFNYFGQFDESSVQAALFRAAPDGGGSARSLTGKRAYLLEINALIFNGRLTVRWSYSQSVHHCSTVVLLAEEFMKSLRALMLHCKSPAVGGFTPSDFPEAALDENELSNILAQLNEREESV